MSTPSYAHMAAEAFMSNKGLGHLRPYAIEPLEDQPCWYFYYNVDGSTLELEVSWSHADGWQVMVTTFAAAEWPVS